MYTAVAVLTRNWWAEALRGVVAILFGLAAIFWPTITLTTLVLLFGAFVFLDGVFAIVAAVRAAEQAMRWWPLLLEGIVGIAIGAVSFARPGVTAVALLYLIAAWAIIAGIMRIVVAVEVRREVRGEWLLAMSGALSVLLGVVLVLFPGAGALALVRVIGAFALLYGVLSLILAFQLRDWRAELEREDRKAA